MSVGKFDHVLLASDFDNTLVHTKAALDAGMNAFTEKPIFVEKLLSTISACLSGEDPFGPTPCVPQDEDGLAP